MKPILSNRFISLLVLALAAFLLASLASCSNSAVTLTSAADATSAPSAPALNGLPVFQDTAATFTGYKVTFKKVEIGNSESDKFTLWENSAGEQKDIISAVTFTGVNKMIEGKYKFLRLTIDPALILSGTVVLSNGTASSVLTRTNTLSTNVFLWGVSGTPGASGNFLLTDTIRIYDGAKLSLTFKIKNTLTMTNDTAVLTAPQVTVKAE